MPSTPADNLSSWHTLGRRWQVAHLLWLGLATLALAQFFTAAPELYRRYTSACAAGCGLTPADVTTLAAWGLSPAHYAGAQLGAMMLFVFTCAAVGGVIFWQAARSPAPRPFALYVALSLTLTGLCLPSGLLYEELLARGDPWSLGMIGVLALSQTLVIFLLLLFPDGRLTPRWLLVPVALLTAVGVGGSFLLPLLGTPRPDTPAALLLNSLAAITMLLAAYVQFRKYRREPGPLRRRQTRWFVGAVAVVAVAVLLQQAVGLLLPAAPLVTLGSTVLVALLALSLPLAVGAAVLRERLWELPGFVGRALVYGTLSAGVVGLYVLLVGGMGALLQRAGDPLVAALASGAVALLALPLRERLQRSVNQLLYGDRDDPYAVVARLGRQIERAAEPESVLHTIVETVAGALKLPYVAISLREGDAERIAAAYGAPSADAVALPLLYRDEQLGELRLEPRGDEPGLTQRDRALLSELARQAGVAIQAARLTQELRQSRERLVVAREEERRRLRRDLHDGVGPTLASLAQRIDTAIYLIAENPQAAAGLLREVKGQVRTSIADIRRAVYDLRPPVLDEFGLVAALRDYTIPAQAGARLTIHLAAEERLPPLPAAVEVAALRIVQEALANVVRHAGARHAEVRLALERSGVLVVEVTDDGRGLPARRSAGVGLRSMRERAEELGGTLSVGPRASGGTRVRATLPLAEPAPPQPGQAREWSDGSDPGANRG